MVWLSHRLPYSAIEAGRKGGVVTYDVPNSKAIRQGRGKIIPPTIGKAWERGELCPGPDQTYPVSKRENRHHNN